MSKYQRLTDQDKFQTTSEAFSLDNTSLIEEQKVNRIKVKEITIQ